MVNIAALIEQQTALIRPLLNLLEEEEGALKQGAAEALAEIGNAKQALVEQLNALDAQRGAALSAVYPGIEAADAMRRWLDSQASDSRGPRAWANLLDLARQVRDRHDVNGQLIRLHLQQTTQALAALQAAGEPLNIYGSDGQTSGVRASRFSDSA